MQPGAEFKLNSKVLFDKIESIKKNPPADILEFKAAHPEFKTVNCALIAEYIGLSEKTLTNLKLGKLTDSNGSTIWLICTSLGIDIRDYFAIPKQSECNPETCSSHAHARLDEKKQRIAELDALCRDANMQLSSLHAIIRNQSEDLGAAKGRCETMDRLISEKDISIARLDKGIRARNHAIIALIAVLALALVVFFRVFQSV